MDWLETMEASKKCHAVEDGSSKLGFGTALLGRGPFEQEELGAELLVLEELEMLELVLITLKLEAIELLVEEGALNEETVELVDAAAEELIELLVDEGALDDEE